MIKDLCPGCGKHCYLNEARCERGIEYANTGVIPPRRPRPDGGHGKKHSEEKMKYDGRHEESVRYMVDDPRHAQRAGIPIPGQGGDDILYAGEAELRRRS